MLPPASLRAIAVFHRRLAAVARARALELEAWERMQRRLERRRRHIEWRPEIWELEREVMRLARRGLSNRAIGKKVKRHPDTVSRIISRVLERSRRASKHRSDAGAHAGGVRGVRNRLVEAAATPKREGIGR
jgi:DNA-binding NarL/FixJ family response regulator